MKEILVGTVLVSLLILMFEQQRRLVAAHAQIDNLTRQLRAQSPLRPFIEMDGPTEPIKVKSNASISVSGYASLPLGISVRSPVWFRAKLMEASSARTVYEDTFMATYSANPRRADFNYCIRNTSEFAAGTYLLVVSVLDDHEEPLAKGTTLVEFSN